MDYCSSCRRHLNGALVCPGCGAYAPDIDPAAYPLVAPAPVAASSAGAAGGAEAADYDTWHDGRPGEETDVVAVAPVTEGRAARRRQRARWKKNQRRAVVATAVALVGGSLTLVAMDQESGDRARAATAPHDPGLSTVEEPTGQEARPATTEPEARRSTPTPSASERAARHGEPGSPRTAPSSTQPEAAAPPRTTAMTAPQPRTTAPAAGDSTASDRTGTSDGTDTAATPTPTPTPPSADDSAGSSSSGAKEPTSPPATTSPEELCLLVLCVG